MIGNSSVYQVKTGGGPYNLASIITDDSSPGSRIKPNFIGQIFVDTANNDGYLAVGAENTDWKKITP